MNKVETRVTLMFDVNASQLLSDEQKQLIHRKLRSKITKDGKLHVMSQRARSQLENKQLVIAGFYELLETALRKPKKRVPTKLTRAQKARIRRKKREHSEKKAARRRDWRSREG